MRSREKDPRSKILQKPEFSYDHSIHMAERHDVAD